MTYRTPQVVDFPGGETGFPTELVAAVESLVFANGAPVTVQQLAEALQGVDPDEITRVLEHIAWRCESGERGIELVRVAGGWQFRTKKNYAPLVLQMRGGRPRALTRPMLEALAVIAYRQPVTRNEVEGIRGVDSGGVIKKLLKKNMIRIAGRREEPGRPLEYVTTELFLEIFGLPSLQALPTLREREELLRDLQPDFEE